MRCRQAGSFHCVAMGDRMKPGRKRRGKGEGKGQGTRLSELSVLP